jgi:hypothetical protein
MQLWRRRGYGAEFGHTVCGEIHASFNYGFLWLPMLSDLPNNQLSICGEPQLCGG